MFELFSMVGRLNNVLLINSNLPPFDLYSFVQPINLLYIFSITEFHNAIALKDKPKGIPK